MVSTAQLKQRVYKEFGRWNVSGPCYSPVSKMRFVHDDFSSFHVAMDYLRWLLRYNRENWEIENE